MANEPTSRWQPGWLVLPGEILLEALQERGMTQAELAQRMARPPKTINEIIKGKAAITAETSIQLERALGISARFWTNLEASYREGIARREAQDALQQNAAWADSFPVKDLVRRHVIRETPTKAETVAELLSFFRVSSPEAFDRHWKGAVAAFRSSPSFRPRPQAIAAWLRWGEIEATQVSHAPSYDARRFRQILKEIREMTRRGPFTQVLKRVQAKCLDAGVIVIMTPEFEGTHVSGATYWVEGKPVIQLSLRHKSNDHFWFTFFHEAGHILGSPRGRKFIDGADLEFAADEGADEEAANRYARDALIPRDDYDAFVEEGDFSSAAVSRFAQVQGIAAGIVVGRLQRDGKIPRSHLNDLKKTIQWPDNRQ